MRIVLEAVGIVLALWLLRALSGVLTPLLVGLILAYMVDPLVVALSKRMARQYAVTVVFGMGSLLLLAAIGVAIPVGWVQGRQLANVVMLGDAFTDRNGNGEFDAGEALTRDLNRNGRFDRSLKERTIEALVRWKLIPSEEGTAPVLPPTVAPGTPAVVDQPALSENASDVMRLAKEKALAWLESLAREPGTALRRIGAILGDLGWWTLAILLVPIYGFFFSLSLGKVSAAIIAHIPRRQRERTVRILGEIHQVVGAFFRGRLIICVILSVCGVIGFSVAGVPSALFLGLALGFGTAVPLAAGLVLIPAAVLLAVDGAAQWQYIVAGVTYLFVQGFETVLLSVVMGKGVEMHPVLVLVAILAFGTLLGAVGVLLAVPLAATARILFREFVYPEVRRLAGLDETDISRPAIAVPPGPPPA